MSCHAPMARFEPGAAAPFDPHFDDISGLERAQDARGASL